MLTWLFLSVVTSIVYFAYILYRHGVTIGGDGKNYLLQANGEILPSPLHYRQVFSKIVGTKPRTWQFLSHAAILLSGPAIYWCGLGYGLSPTRAFLGVVLWLGLYGVFGIAIEEPVRPDPMAVLLMCLATGFFLHGLIFIGIFFSILAALCKEVTPLFIAIASSPLALVAMCVPIAMYFIRPEMEDCHFSLAHHPLLTNPILTVRNIRLHDDSNWKQFLAPWGVALILALLNPTIGLGLTLLLGYAQLIVATDSSRLFQFGFLPVILLAATTMPLDWAFVLCGIHLFQPFHGMRDRK